MTSIIFNNVSGYDQIPYSNSERQILQGKRAVEAAKQVVANKGLRAHHWSGIGSENIDLPLVMSNTIQALEKQEGYLDIAIGNISAMHKALKEMANAVTKARNIWIMSQNDASIMDAEVKDATIRISAEAAIQNLVNFLSIQGARGEYLFGGNIDNISPLKHHIAKANIVNNNPNASYYQGSLHYKELHFAMTNSTAEVESIAIKVKADDKWVQSIFAALYAMHDTKTKRWNGNIELWFKEGVEGLDCAAMELGLLQAKLESVKKYNQNNILDLKQQFDSIMKQSEQEATVTFLDAVDSFNHLADLERKVRDMFSKFLESYR